MAVLGRGREQATRFLADYPDIARQIEAALLSNQQTLSGSCGLPFNQVLSGAYHQ
jgi:hypothetical protein